jgi:CBS domain containing-hemolysin-like protein
MTPRPVVFAVPAELTVADYFERYEQKPFSRIPVYERDPEDIVGFVLRNDLLLARAREEGQAAVGDYRREIPKLPEQVDLSRAFDRFLKERAHMMLVIDEYGGFTGILTLEDVLETLLGIEIVDESDTSEDMQRLARQLWEQRARTMGLDLEAFGVAEKRNTPPV